MNGEFAGGLRFHQDQRIAADIGRDVGIRSPGPSAVALPRNRFWRSRRPSKATGGAGPGDVPADVANGRALLINDYAASPVQARPLSLVAVAECAA